MHHDKKEDELDAIYFRITVRLITVSKIVITM